MTNNRLTPQFTPDCTKGETIFGLFWLLMHMFVCPLLLNTVQETLLPDLTPVAGNALYYGISLAVTLLFGMKLLRREFDHLLDRLFHCVRGFFATYLFWYAMSLAMVAVLSLLNLTQELPNDMAMDELATENYRVTLTLSVIVAPILEEILFRGILFQSVRKRSRLWAYVISIAMFSLYHVWQFAYYYADWHYLLFALQYIPITLALTWGYEHTGSLWVPIFFHASNNYLAMQVMQMM